ncbi:hypothetical protein GGR57DRAFT_75210 [Xylariaceae sp. FL1272]|nr:hypothetical protein GGR57DRAFT_75210 [Xylariaceae sp. FL1272]
MLRFDPSTRFMVLSFCTTWPLMISRSVDGDDPKIACYHIIYSAPRGNYAEPTATAAKTKSGLFPYVSESILVLGFFRLMTTPSRLPASR